MRVFFVLSFLLVVGAHFGRPAIVVWSEDEGGNGHGYEVVQWGGSWEIGNTLAQLRGGYLATITSAAENDFVVSLIRSPEFWNVLENSTGPDWWDGPWIGGLQDNPRALDTGWKWVTGEEFSYTNWHPGQPDDQLGDQDRLHYWDSGDGLTMQTIKPQWDDQQRWIFTNRAFIVEYDVIPVPEPSALWLGLAGGIFLGLGARVRSRLTVVVAASRLSKGDA